MAMHFTGPDRPNKILEEKINKGETPYKGLLFSGDDSFQSILASDRYNIVVENVRRYNNFNLPLQNSLSEIGFKMASATNDVFNIEARYKKQLEQLAINLVRREMGIPKGMIDFDAKLINPRELDTTKFNKNKNEKVEIDTELINEKEYYSEKKKRRIINAIIQGAAKRGHYMYQLVEDDLEKITNSKNLVRAYNIMMSVNDTYYWQLDDTTFEHAVFNSNPVGLCDVEFPDDYENDFQANPKVIARAINFPVLVHELVKGVMELFSYHGQSDNKVLVEMVLKTEDTLSKELWDLRMGPSLWDKLKNQMPEEILVEDDMVELQNYLLVDIFKLPSDEFLALIEDVIQNKGAYKLKQMTEKIKYHIANREYEDIMKNFGMSDEE